MKYEYEDIGRLRLSPKLAREFIDLMKVKYFMSTRANYKKGAQSVRAVLAAASALSYRSGATYVLASNDRERALAAMEGPSGMFKQEALELWLSVIANMTEFEKVMAGWDKV